MPESHISSGIFVKTYRNLLADEGILRLNDLAMTYEKIVPSLHPGVASDDIDFGALFYCLLRLPRIIYRIGTIYLAQTEEIFHKEGIGVEHWELVEAPARRRKMYFDGDKNLAVYVNSITDVDDIVCMLLAYSIEWNKMHKKLSTMALPRTPQEAEKLFHIDRALWEKYGMVFRGEFPTWLAEIKKRTLSFTVRALKGTYVDYQKAMQKWFDAVEKGSGYPDFKSRPVYVISSNMHSIVNTVTGWVNQYEPELISFMKRESMGDLLSYWNSLGKNQEGLRENVLWYVLKKYEKKHPEIAKKRKAFEKKAGIVTVDAKHYLDVNAQIISISSLVKSHLATKLQIKLSELKHSNALILNIDYPLGFGAYMVLSTLLRNISQVRGVYILGKASFFTGGMGDIGLPNFAHDETSHNAYYFTNAFSRQDFADKTRVNVIENQRVISSKGTLLHSYQFLADCFNDGYTILEMEVAPYLNALYEGTTYQRYPEGKTMGLFNSPIDIGVINYASDTPFTKAVTLATRNLGFDGVEATYVSSLVILKRIVEREKEIK